MAEWTDALAFHITWNTYGAWLHGDARGSVDIDHNKPSTPRAKPSEARVNYHRGRMKHEPYKISAAARAVILQTIEEVTEHRAWSLYALNVRLQHVHLIASGAEPDKLMRDYKAWCTRRLRDAGLSDGEVWAEGGSKKWLFGAEDLAIAIDYVLNRQGPDLPVA